MGTPETRRRVAAAGVVALVLGSATALLVANGPRPRRTSGTLPHEIYVWQRAWDEAVPAALERSAGQAAGFVALAAEVSWEDGRAHVARAHLDYGALRDTGKPVGLALRVGPHAGPFDDRNDATALLVGLAASLIGEARAAGLEPAELQIDFDCATSKLDGYRRWVEAIRAATADVPLAITALPTWLPEPAFAALARATDGYVLQVHSLEPPGGPEAPMSLCEPAAARRCVDKADRVGVPFRVALPTYGYLAAFREDGSLLGISAEGRSRAWDEDVALRSVRSDPAAMARLVRDWEGDPPAALMGIIWYRLPVEGDQLNWRWQTLSAIIAGRVPRPETRVEVVRPEPELADIFLVNAGETGISSPVCVDVTWQQGDLLAADGLRGCTAQSTSPTGARLRLADPEGLAPLAPGERRHIAWLRFRYKAEVNASVAVR
jgi:hypothetical protein